MNSDAKCSCYILDIQYGNSSHLRWALNNLVDIDRALQLTMKRIFWITATYETEIYLRVAQNGTVAQKINLLPFLTIEARGLPTVRFDRTGKIAADIAELLEKIGEEKIMSLQEDLIALEEEEGYFFTASIDWNNANIRSLQGKLLQRGETTIVPDDGTFYFQENEIRYGLIDLENEIISEDIESARVEYFCLSERQC